MKLKNKVSIVTGAGSGIGHAIALKFAEQGSDIVLVGRTKEKIEKTGAKIVKMGVRALPIVADVAASDEVVKAVEEAWNEFQRIDILVNNAGISRAGKIVDVTENDWDDVLNINLKGVYLLCKEVGKRMMASKQGKIINISSMAGRSAERGNVPYSVSKSGVISLTQGLALELADHGINVNAICPGFTYTEMIQQIFVERAPVLNITPEELKQRFENGIPVGRMGTPNDVANLALFLASEDSNYITGQGIVIDGGFELTRSGM
jgi:3-oxoacyl-[acyl-carrier protein] reductase